MKGKYLITVLCMFLIVSMPIIFAALENPTPSFDPTVNQPIQPASSINDPNFGGNLGGYVYNNPLQEEIRQSTGFYNLGPEQFLGEAIIVNVKDYEPKQVRESLLEQQDVPVFIYLRGTTVGNLFPFVTGEPTAQDPLTSISNIPPIDSIIVRPNLTIESSKYIRFVNYIPPRRDKYSLNNLGYLVVYLKRLESENNTPADNLVSLDLNARIYLRLQDSTLFGLSEQDLTLKPSQNETEFFSNKAEGSFFSGRGYVRVSRISGDTVTLQVYNKNLFPLALYTPNPSPLNTGISPNSFIVLRKGETSRPISFGYSGNPLNDLFRITLNDISTATDKAELEYKVNGKKVIRKIAVGNRLYPGSSWIIKSVKNTDKKKISVSSTLGIIGRNIDDVVKEFNLNQVQRNHIISLIVDSNLDVFEVTHTIELENQISGEHKVISRKIISYGEGGVIKYNYKPIANDRADFLVSKYCNRIDGKVSQTDIACQAIGKYKDLLKFYSESDEAYQAKKDLKDIFNDQLIEFVPCTKELQGLATPTEVNECKEYEADMADLALYYASLIGDEEEIFGKLGTLGGADYLQDEGIALQLRRVITVSDERPSINLKLYDDRVGEYEKTLRQGDFITDLGGVKFEDKGNYTWKVESVFSNNVNLRLYEIKPNKDPSKAPDYRPTDRSKSLKLGEKDAVTIDFPPKKDGQLVRPEITRGVMVTKIDMKSEAYLTISPGAGRAFTSSNFKVHIPVDPRPFKWTPDELQSQIDSTKKIISDLDGVIKKLDDFISTMKKVCLSVFAVLTIKNSVTGTRNIARREVSTHYKSRCQTEVGEGQTRDHPKFTTIDACLSHYSDQIKSSTDKTEVYMDEINNKIKGKTADDLVNVNLASPSEEAICGNFKQFREASIGVNQEEIVREYRDCLLSAKIQNDGSLNVKYREYANQTSTEIGIREKIEVYKQAKDYASRDPADEWNETNPKDLNKIMLRLQRDRVKDKKSVDVLEEAIKLKNTNPGHWAGSGWVEDPVNKGKLQQVKVRGLNQYQKILLDEGDETKAKEVICKRYVTDGTWDSNQCKIGTRLADDQVDYQIKKLKNESVTDKGKQVFINEKYYKELDAGINHITAIPDTNTCSSFDGDYASLIPGLFSSVKCKPKVYYSTAITDSTGRTLNTAYSYGTDLVARYDQDGLVYCYPTGKGEYALVLERYGNKLIKKIRVMNVGSNGLIECGGGDDEYAQGGDETALETNLQTKQRYVQLGERLRRCTKENVPGAVRDGEQVGIIDGRRVVCDLKAAETLNELSQPKCIDVMDPSDCKILFNFCDPVMCPSTRCNLGGRVPQRNVVQSGLVGSAVLCLPNINQGIAMPVCLTGISAGLKNIKSILEGYSNCLEINLKQGKNVGVCDYIRSVGICEMVWRETYNLLSISGGLVDWVGGKVGGAPQGGAEYLRFQSSLENVGESVRVFTNEYKTTYTAQFLSQSTEEIGTQICRLSVNGKLPSIGKILDQLTEPENPPQFTAFFDETPYAAPGESPALPTVPLGSQDLSLYNVFYHIYAGTGPYQGVYSQPQSLFSPTTQPVQQPIVYSVYLINREMGYFPLYVTNPGEFGQLQSRIDAGRYAQQSVQKIGKKGYNQICVNINGVEQCGFGRVSTSFGLSELKDVVNKQEATREISSAEQCVPDTQKTPSYSAAKLGTLGATQVEAGANLGQVLTPQVGAIGTGVVTSGIIETNLFSRGIVRVCSVNEPTSETGRWSRVGSCGNDKSGKSRGECWLDVKSVKIDDLKISNQLKDELRGRAESQIKVLDVSSSKDILTKLNQKKEDILNSIRGLVQQAKKTQPKPAPRNRTIPTPPPTSTGPLPAGANYYITTYQKEKDLSPIVYDVATKHDFLGSPIRTYFFLKSTIKRESDWKTRYISCAGAVGIAQIMPHTAKNRELRGVIPNIQDPINRVEYCPASYSASHSGHCPVCLTGSKDNAYAAEFRKEVGSLTDSQLAAFDDRFDDEKAIEALALYYEESAKKLSAATLAVNPENLAATYNKGRGAISDIKTLGGIPPSVKGYTSDINNYYNKLCSDSGAC